MRDQSNVLAQAGPTDRVLIVGVGNEALRDEGIGLHAARTLAERDLPPGVEVLEGGTGGFTLLGRFIGVRRLVLVDAMAMGRPPGTVVTVRPEEIRGLAPPDRSSLHGTGLLDVLELATALGLRPPEVLIVGVQPAEVAWGLELSPTLQQALPQVIEAVLWAASHSTENTRRTANGQREEDPDHRR